MRHIKLYFCIFNIIHKIKGLIGHENSELQREHSLYCEREGGGKGEEGVGGSGWGGSVWTEFSIGR